MYIGESTCGINLVEWLKSSDLAWPEPDDVAIGYWRPMTLQASIWSHVRRCDFWIFQYPFYSIEGSMFSLPIRVTQSSNLQCEKRGLKKSLCSLPHWMSFGSVSTARTIMSCNIISPHFPLNQRRIPSFLNKNVQPQCKGTLADQINRLAWASNFP